MTVPYICPEGKDKMVCGCPACQSHWRAWAEQAVQRVVVPWLHDAEEENADV